MRRRGAGGDGGGRRHVARARRRRPGRGAHGARLHPGHGHLRQHRGGRRRRRTLGGPRGRPGCGRGDAQRAVERAARREPPGQRGDVRVRLSLPEPGAGLHGRLDVPVCQVRVGGHGGARLRGLRPHRGGAARRPGARRPRRPRRRVPHRGRRWRHGAQQPHERRHRVTDAARPRVVRRHRGARRDIGRRIPLRAVRRAGQGRRRGPAARDGPDVRGLHRVRAHRHAR